MPEPQHIDWTPLVGLNTGALLQELAIVHSTIANLILQVGFLRQEELRGQQHAKDERIGREAELNAMTEKKWLLVKLLENHE